MTLLQIRIVRLPPPFAPADMALEDFLSNLSVGSLFVRFRCYPILLAHPRNPYFLWYYTHQTLLIRLFGL